MFEEGRRLFDECVKKGLLAIAKQEEQMIRDILIGSRITDIRIEPIKNRKTVRRLIIGTDAGLVKTAENTYLDLSEINVRIKSKS